MIAFEKDNRIYGLFSSENVTPEEVAEKHGIRIGKWSGTKKALIGDSTDLFEGQQPLSGKFPLNQGVYHSEGTMIYRMDGAIESYVKGSGTIELDSSITGSNYELTKQGTGDTWQDSTGGLVVYAKDELAGNVPSLRVIESLAPTGEYNIPSVVWGSATLTE